MAFEKLEEFLKRKYSKDRKADEVKKTTPNKSPRPYDDNFEIHEEVSKPERVIPTEGIVDNNFEIWEDKSPSTPTRSNRTYDDNFDVWDNSPKKPTEGKSTPDGSDDESEMYW